MNFATARATTPATEPSYAEFSRLQEDSQSWADFLSTVAQCRRVSDAFLAGSQISARGKTVLATAGALETRNSLLLQEIRKTAPDFSFDESEVALYALQVSVQCDIEDFACHFAARVRGTVPLWVVHRAGEKGMLRLLKALCDFKVHIASSRVLGSVVRKLRAILKRRGSCIRFDSPGKVLQSEDIIKWALLSGGIDRVREVLCWGLDLADSSLCAVLLSEGLGTLLEELVAGGRLVVTSATAGKLLEYGRTALLYKLVQVTTTQRAMSWFVSGTPELLRNYDVVDQLIALISDEPQSLMALRLLSLVKGADWDSLQTENFCAKVHDMLYSSDLDHSPVANHHNPLMLCTAVSEVCELLGRAKPLRRDKLQRLARTYRNLAEKIQNQYTEYRQLKILYTDRCYGDFCLFDVLTRDTERYRGLLKSDIVVAIVQDLWCGGDPGELHFQEMCLATRLFECRAVFSVHRDVQTQPKSVFQLVSWKRNGNLRFAVEAAGLLLLYGMIISTTFVYVRASLVLQDASSTPAEQAAAEEQIVCLQGVTTAYNYTAVALVLYVAEKLVYQRLMGVPVIFQGKDAMDVATIFLAVFNQAFTTDEVLNSLSATEAITISDPAFAAMFLLAGLRIALTLLVNRTLGPMLRMVFIVIRSLFAFMCIYALALIAFAICANNVFYAEPEFASLLDSHVTLFQWSTGGIDFSVFHIHRKLGLVFGVLWMFISAVVLLNLLIAVLSSRYEELAPQCTADYTSVLYQSYCQGHYEPPYGALVTAPAPFSVITFPLVPLYLAFPKSARKTDTVFVILTYQLLFWPGLCAFAIYVTVYSLIAYLYVCCQHFLHLSVRRPLSFLPWVCLGPFYLFYLGMLSIRDFCSVMYSSGDPDSEEVLSQEVVSQAKKMLAKACHHRESCIVRIHDLEALATPMFYSVDRNKADSVFRRVAHRFTHSQFSARKRQRIIAFFKQFMSYTDEQTIDLVRMQRLLSAQTIVATNLYYSQKALAQVRAERSKD